MEKAETLDGAEIWYLISVMAFATAITNIIYIVTRDIRYYGSRIRGFNRAQRLTGGKTTAWGW